MTNELKQALLILRRKQVEDRTGLKRSTLYTRIDPRSKYFDPAFPKPVKLGANAIGWIAEEIEAWIRSRIDSRD